jgi:3'5'-cyclic nucleotide phosphodiesterase
MAAKYRNKSIAEQHSIDLAWDILMQDKYKNLRRVLFATQEELMRFRHLLVNVVLATDIFDRELNAARRQRWGHAFAAENAAEVMDTMSKAILSDKKATIVIEHIIQASDVSHTMQHWHIYQKWNRYLFVEMTAAYHAGRLEKDPAEFWELGELGFCDNYVIPFAKKLQECGVFGVYSDEYLVFAKQNRDEWEQRGGEIVAQWSDAIYAVIAKGGDIRKAAKMDEKDFQVCFHWLEILSA